jgi:hypothetical protein
LIQLRGDWDAPISSPILPKENLAVVVSLEGERGLGWTCCDSIVVSGRVGCHRELAEGVGTGVGWWSLKREKDTGATQRGRYLIGSEPERFRTKKGVEPERLGTAKSDIAVSLTPLSQNSAALLTPLSQTWQCC